MNINFDTIKEKAASAAQVAAQKTKEFASVAKANISIYAEEDKIKKAQVELGKLYYRDYVLGEEMDNAEYLPWCDQITESKAVIEDLKDMIADLKKNGDAADFVDATEEGLVPTEEAKPEEAKPEEEKPAE